MTPIDDWLIAKALADHHLNGELEGMSSSVRPFLEKLLKTPKKQRATFFDGWRFGQPDPDGIARRVADADLTTPPSADPAKPRAATAADVRRLMSSTRWSWEGWIPGSTIFGLAGPEGAGKTRSALDLHRRVYKGLPWPDGSPPTVEAGRPALWLCSDGQHAEICETIEAYGLPDSSIAFPAFSDEPFLGDSIDDPEMISPGGILDQVIGETRPWVMFVDTLTYATAKDLCQQSVMKALSDPLKRICQEHQIPVGLLLHVSREGHALGRRIKGITRTLLKLENPDTEEGDGRLRFWVEKSFAKVPQANGKPLVLGVRMTDEGNEYDFAPPTKSEGPKVGRPSTASDRVTNLIIQSLEQNNNRRYTELREELEREHGDIATGTFSRAVDSLCKSGRIKATGGPRDKGGDGTPRMLFLDPRAPQ